MKTVGFTYDWDGPLGHAPEVGDYVLGKRTGYRIVSCRQVRSRVHPCRWAVRAERLRPEEVPSGVRVYPIVWHKRKRQQPQ